MTPEVAARELVLARLRAQSLDSCSCVKAEGMYGMEGFHYAVVDEDFIFAAVSHYAELERQKPNGGEWRGGIFVPFEASRRFWQDNGETHYLGSVVVWERCPAYMARVRSNLQSAKVETASKGRRRTEA